MTDYLALAERLERLPKDILWPLQLHADAAAALREAHATQESFDACKSALSSQTAILREAHAEIEKYDEANEHLKKREVWLNDLLFKGEQEAERLRALLREAREDVECCDTFIGSRQDRLARIDAELGEKHG